MEETNQKVSALVSFIETFTPKLIGALVVLFIGLWVANVIVRMMQRRMEKTKVDESLQPFLLSLVNVLLKIMVIFSAAGIVGIQTTSFVAMLGAAGLAVGLALQGSLSNFASGVLILLFRPYRVGDIITVGGFSGTVKEIQIFTTVLATVDNRMIIIPNSAITSGPIENTTAYTERVVEVLVPIDPTQEMNKVREIIETVGKTVPGYVDGLGITSPVVDVKTTAVTLAARVWVKPLLFLEAEAFFKEALKNALQAAGIDGEHEPVMEVKLVQQ